MVYTVIIVVSVHGLDTLHNWMSSAAVLISVNCATCCSMSIVLFFAPTGCESVSQQSSYSHRSQPKPLQNKSGWTEGSSGYGSASPSTVDSESEDSSSSPATLVGCGCGKCSLYTLCSKGCSKPSGGTPLPIWNGTECTYPANSWQYSYESKLIDDTNLQA